MCSLQGILQYHIIKLAPCVSHKRPTALCRSAVHEVVEVDGFIFRRKRRTTLAESAGAEPAKRPREERRSVCTSGEPSVQAPAPAAALADAYPQVGHANAPAEPMNSSHNRRLAMVKQPS